MKESNTVVSAKIDYQLTPGTKIRCIIDQGAGGFLTEGKIYEVIAFTEANPWLELQFWFIDDDGDEMYSSPEHQEFEVVG